MAKLEVPDAAVRAHYGDPMTERITNKTAEAVLRHGAPIIVAAELRRMARDYERRSDNVPLSAVTSAGIARVGELRERAQDLRTRADELDGDVR